MKNFFEALIIRSLEASTIIQWTIDQQLQDRKYNEDHLALVQEAFPTKNAVFEEQLLARQVANSSKNDIF